MKRIANQEITARRSETVSSAYTITTCGIASSQCTSGRQLAIRSGASKLNVAG